MKDFTQLKNYIEQNGLVKTKDALALGYRPYDLKQFMEASYIKRLCHGLYALAEEPEKVEISSLEVEEQTTKEIPALEQPPEEIVPKPSVGELTYQGIGCIFTRNYEQALPIFKEVCDLEPQNGNNYFYLSYLYFVLGDYEQAYKNLEISVENHTQNLISAYLISLVLKKFIDVPESFPLKIRNQLDQNGISHKFYCKVFLPIEKEDFLPAKKYTFYFIRANNQNKNFRIGNHYLYATLCAVVDKLGLKPEFTSKKEEPSRVGVPRYIKPPIEEKQLLANTILLNALDNEDYDEAFRLVQNYELADSKTMIILLINKLREVKKKGGLLSNGPVRIIKEEPVQIIGEEQEEYEFEEPDETIDAEPTTEESISVLEVQESNQSKANEKYSLYHEAMDSYDFASARKALMQYDYLLKQQGSYRNLDYHYRRIEEASVSFTLDQEHYIQERNTYGTIFALLSEKKYDEALAILETLEDSTKKNNVIARIYISQDKTEEAYQLLMTIEDCIEPDYYRNMAVVLFRQHKYKDALEYCFKYNECRPKKTPEIYLLMASIYEKLRKPSKALKALRIVDELNRERNYRLDLSERIRRNEYFAVKNKEKRLALANNHEYYE